MKKLFSFICSVIFVLSITFAQDTATVKSRKLPSVDIKNLSEKTVKTSSFSNNGKAFIISFWATWCKPCITELTNISDVYDEWQEETGVKIIAVSVDDARTKANVKPMIESKGWPYEFYSDVNSDFARAMNVVAVPYTLVLNGNGEIVWQHQGYVPGDENNLIEIIRKVNKGLPVSKE